MKRVLGRKIGHRQHLLKNLAASLVLHEQIKTTLPKAKELRMVIEPLITLGKKAYLAKNPERLALYREILARVGNQPTVARKLIDDIGKRVQERNGGYLRIFKVGFRVGDAAPVALVQLVDKKDQPQETTNDKVTKKAAKTKDTKVNPKAKKQTKLKSK